MLISKLITLLIALYNPSKYSEPFLELHFAFCNEKKSRFSFVPVQFSLRPFKKSGFLARIG